MEYSDTSSNSPAELTKRFLENMNNESERKFVPNDLKSQFGISEIDRNGQVRVKRGFRFDEYIKAEEAISKLPSGQYQIQKIYIVD
jgi:hypothetical protein